MSDLVFVLHKQTGHAYPISAATVDEEVHVVLNEPATLAGGQPRPPIYNYPKPTEEAPKPTSRPIKPDTKEK